MRIIDTIDLSQVGALLESMARETTRAIADALAEEIFREAPHDTGFLKSSISVQEAPDGKRIRVQVGAYYSIYVEFGFIHWISGKHIPPNPFFRRAIDNIKIRFPDLVVKESFLVQESVNSV